MHAVQVVVCNVGIDHRDAPMSGGRRLQRLQHHRVVGTVDARLNENQVSDTVPMRQLLDLAQRSMSGYVVGRPHWRRGIEDMDMAVPTGAVYRRERRRRLNHG